MNAHGRVGACFQGQNALDVDPYRTIYKPKFLHKTKRQTMDNEWTLLHRRKSYKLPRSHAPRPLFLSPLSLRGFLLGNVASAVRITLKRVLN